MTKKAYIHTFGCQMNFHDSEKMAGVLKEGGYGLADNPEDADLVVFNTCSIREKAEQKFLSELGRVRAIKRGRPSLRIAVAGCIAQQMGEKLFKKAPFVDCVIGPQNIDKIAEFADAPQKIRRTFTDDNSGLVDLVLPAIRKDKGRAWVNIMYGCNNFCSYCIVPYTRGRERSRPPESVVTEIEKLSSEGFQEVTLLGQNVNSYKGEGGFPSLLRRINEISGIERVRFVTSHPRDLTADLIDHMAVLNKVCEHIHLPLQSGSSKILKLMNRGYTYEDYKEKIDRLREKIPGVAITSDIIAGFPGETDDDHAATMKALGEIEYDGIFAFKYSSRPGTKAADMDRQLPDDIKLLRLKEILGLQDDITLQKNKSLEGAVLEVFVEGESETDGGRLTGRTRTNKIVNFTGIPEFINKLIDVKILEAKRHSLLGEAADKHKGR